MRISSREFAHALVAVLHRPRAPFLKFASSRLAHRFYEHILNHTEITENELIEWQVLFRLDK